MTTAVPRSAMEDMLDQPELPRKALLRNGGKKGASDLVSKRSVKFNIKDSTGTIRLRPTSTTQIRFDVSAHELLDAQQSYFQLTMRTNQYTSLLNGSITALIKRLTLRLPSCGDKVVESIDELAALDTAIHLVSTSPQQMASGFPSALNSLDDPLLKCNTNRKFQNLCPAGWRTYLFQIRFGLLAAQFYVPLKQIGGLSICLELHSVAEAFQWQHANEALDTVFSRVSFPFVTQAAYDAMDPAAQAQVCNDMAAYYDKDADPDNRRELVCEIKDFTYVASLVEMSPSYVTAYDKLASGSGTSLMWDSYFFTDIKTNGSSKFTYQFCDDFQNAQCCLFLALDEAQVRDGINSLQHWGPIQAQNMIRDYSFRIGAQEIGDGRDPCLCTSTEVNCDALAYGHTLLATGRFEKLPVNNVKWSTNRKMNIYACGFQRAQQDDLYCGLSSCEGLKLHMNITTNQQPEVQINGTVIQPQVDPGNMLVYVFVRHTTMLHLSKDGISVTR